MLQLLRTRHNLPPHCWLSCNGRPIRPHLPLHSLPLTPGSTVDIQCCLPGGAPPDSPSNKRHRTQARPDAIPALRAFASGPFLFWRQRVPPTELALDIARLVTRWTASGVDVVAVQGSLADALGTPPDQAIEILWAWELICGHTYDPLNDTFSTTSPMDVDSSSSPLDDVARLRRELDRVTQEAAALRAQMSPPLNESNLLQLLAASPASPWIHALGEVLLHHLRTSAPSATATAALQPSSLADGVWSVLQQFARPQVPHPARGPTPPTHPSSSLPSVSPAAPFATQGVCFNCGRPGHWARHCHQHRTQGHMPTAPSFRQGGLSVLPSGQTIFTSATGRTYDASSQPPYPCGVCQQWHWYFQPCPAKASPSSS